MTKESNISLILGLHDADAKALCMAVDDRWTRTDSGAIVADATPKWVQVLAECWLLFSGERALWELVRRGVPHVVKAFGEGPEEVFRWGLAALIYDSWEEWQKHTRVPDTFFAALLGGVQTDGTLELSALRKPAFAWEGSVLNVEMA